MFKNLFAPKKVAPIREIHLFGDITSVAPFSMTVEMPAFGSNLIDEYYVSFNQSKMQEQAALALELAESKKPAKMRVSVSLSSSLPKEPVLELINFEN